MLMDEEWLMAEMNSIKLDDKDGCTWNLSAYLWKRFIYTV